MKLILENWNLYLNEESKCPEATQDPELNKENKKKEKEYGKNKYYRY